MSEIKPLSFSLFTLFFFFVLTSMMSPNLFLYSSSYELITPEAYQSADIGNYRFVHNVTVNDANFIVFQGVRRYQFELGGQYWVMMIDVGYNHFKLGRRNYFGIFWISTDWSTFRHESGTDRGEFLDDS